METFFLKSKKKSNKLAITLIISSLAIIGTILLYNSQNSLKILNEIQAEEQEFVDFVIKYSKFYHSIPEYFKRFEIFKENLAYIKASNSLSSTVILGITQFADMTPEEFQSKYTSKVPKILSNFATSASVSLPASVNWVSKGAVPPVVNQGQCGGAVPISAVGSIDSAWFLAGHPLTILSVQQVYDCLIGSCSGGVSLDEIYQYAKKYGLTSNSIYPYTGNVGTCNQSKASQVVVKLASYVDVQPSNMTALQVAVAQQPVAVYVDASSWMLYVSGTISSGCGTGLDHSVLVVGYQTQASPPYWTAQNSWGTSWGMSGYVQIAMSNGSGVCGINMGPSYPVI